MEVEIYRAILTIEGKKVKLTKAIAKQFPIRRLGTRDVMRGSVKEPLGKVRGEVLGASSSWLYLVKDEEAGLAWEPAIVYEPVNYGKGMEERGYNVDHPEEVPTLIL